MQHHMQPCLLSFYPHEKGCMPPIETSSSLHSANIMLSIIFRDFAYVARDPSTSKHKCHMFRCHGNISGRAITTALHEMCNKILEEKKRAQEISKKNSQAKPWSDIINTPPSLSVKG